MMDTDFIENTTSEYIRTDIKVLKSDVYDTDNNDLNIMNNNMLEDGYNEIYNKY